jgi:hypothetical protein
MAIHRLRRVPHAVTLTQGAQTLYEITLSAVPSPEWRAACLRPPARLTTAQNTPQLGRLGLTGGHGALPDHPGPAPRVVAPHRPLDRVRQLGGGGVTDAELGARGKVRMAPRGGLPDAPDARRGLTSCYPRSNNDRCCA